jgi:hypothetical protein
MQIENEEKQPLAPAADPTNSHPLHPVSLVQGNENDDPDEIFLNAVAEIDTQPLIKVKKPLVIQFTDILQLFFCSSLIVCAVIGILYQAITYPHTLVVLFTQARPAQITTTLDVPTRTLAPVTLTRSLTVPTTGHGHQDATQATGTVVFYNGSATPQYVPSGSVFTGNDGVKITTVQSITVPAANLPAIGSMLVQAVALRPGSQGNIAAFDVNSALSPVLKGRNETPFTNGKDARDFHAVAQTDLDRETAQVTHTLFTAFQTAFPVRPGEQAQPTTCHTTTTADHALGQEALTVTVKMVKTCSAVAYNSQQLESLATRAFTRTKPAASYHLVGSVQTTLQSVSPLSVAMSGKWAYTFSPDYQQRLAQQIQGDTPAKARASLLKTGVISYASVPETLPPAMYITFLVLVG